MYSRFAHLRGKAVSLRENGKSIRDIEIELGIPRSTLSGWLRTVQLTVAQKTILKKRWNNALVRARVEASAWHRKAKQKRLALIAMGADEFVGGFTKSDVAATELALAFLYLGEGSKKNVTSLGSSDPRILRFFIVCLKGLYGVPLGEMKCELHLRADQDAQTLIRYWSRLLRIPRENFGKASFDKRTAGRPTYSHYKGVCVVRCGRVEIQRRLLYIAGGFCNKIAGAASLGG